MSIVELHQVRVDLAAVRAVDGVDLSVEAGEVVALLGPNGAGKTTTLETIEGYRCPTGGTVRVFGVDPVRQRRDIAHRWGVMPQTGGLPTGMTVAEAIGLFADLTHPDAAEAARRRDRAVEITGLDGLLGRRWRRLSGGEQQRLSLALALVGGDDLLLLDEPTAAVDAEGRRRVLDAITTRADAGSAVLVTTHRFDDVEAVADRVVVLDRGRVVAADTVATLTEGHDDVTITLDHATAGHELDAGLADAIAERFGAAPTQLPDGRVRIATPADADAVAALTGLLAEHGVVARSIEAGRRSLAERFDELLAESGEETR